MFILQLAIVTTHGVFILLTTCGCIELRLHK